MKSVTVPIFLLAVATLGTGASVERGHVPSVGKETLVILYQPEDDLALPLFIDELAPETLLTITASGFDADTTGAIAQCVEGSVRQCRNRLPVRFDERGDATFQYLVTDDIDPCRLIGERCTIELSTSDKVSVIDTVFVDTAPALGLLEVMPRRDLLVGDTVTVAASEFPPEVELTVMICAAPSSSGARCGAPGPEIPVAIGPDGTAEVDIVLDVSKVGSAGVACGRQVRCHVVVTSEQRGVRARAVTLSFADSLGAEYTTSRIIIGLTTALSLALVAAWLISSTDWRPPRESDSTLIDEADYADLDLEAANFDDP